MARHLYIAGVDRWSDLIKDTLQIEAVLTYQVDTTRFRVRGEQPTKGEEVIIEDDTLGRLFGGIIVKVELVDKDLKVWAVECDDYTNLLDRRLVVETYENLSASDIFLDIANLYCPGFTTNGVLAGAPVVEYIRFDYIPVSNAFKQLCEYVGWQWRLGYDKDLQFFSTEMLVQPAPLVLEPGGRFRNLKHAVDMTGLRNRVYVLGGRFLSDPQTFEYVADGKQRIWVLPYEPHSPQVSVQGGAPITPGLEYVDDEANYAWMYSQKDKYIRCSNHTPTPIEGATVAFTYRYPMDVITMVEDLASQQALAAVQGGDGIYEHKIVDDTLITIEAAEAAGLADLREHANPRVKGSFETEVPGWAPGQLVTINLPDRGIQGTFLVQKVTITPAWPDPNLWTFKVEYGGRLLGIPDLLAALVAGQKHKMIVDVKYQSKFVLGDEKIGILDEAVVAPRTEPWYCGDPDAICGEIICLAVV